MIRFFKELLELSGIANINDYFRILFLITIVLFILMFLLAFYETRHMENQQEIQQRKIKKSSYIRKVKYKKNIKRREC